MSKHTPGPWHLSDALDGHSRLTRIVSSEGKTVARTDAHFGRPHHWQDEEANARLVAAVPELLKELVAYHDLLCKGEGCSGCELLARIEGEL